MIFKKTFVLYNEFKKTIPVRLFFFLYDHSAEGDTKAILQT